MEMATSLARRSKCVRRQVGAVIISPDNSQVWVGYNGPPSEWTPAIHPILDTSCDRWCERSKLSNLGRTMASYDNCITIHAEKNALLKSDPTLRRGGKIYVTSFPCWDCAKAIANSGIIHVVTRYDRVADEHRMPRQTMDMLADSGLEVEIYDRVN
jgi:dCMP deaminase